ncbi:hypothetical protein B9J78_04970 [bacterium Unc6]|nr:hypothetical protein [bacterium Unc6]
MPTYEYECTKCSHHFEVFQHIKDETLKKCPKCDGKVKRLISGGSGLLFKGKGFYTTDYRKPSYHMKAEKEKAPCPADKTVPSTCASCPVKKS